MQADLYARQADLNRKAVDPDLGVDAEWWVARQGATMTAVVATLRRMMGDRQRCMYCLDSHGTDIDHFWPKSAYPRRMLLWLDFLLSCTECGRFKLNRFPLRDGQPLLIDPTAENPWLNLDFDPLTGNIVARFDPAANQYAEKGATTQEGFPHRVSG